MKLYIIQFADPKSYVNRAAVFSADPLDDKIANVFQEAQEVIEAQWLANYTPQSYCILLLPKELGEVGTQLFDKVQLIQPEDWDSVVGGSEAVLINSHLFSLLCSEEDSEKDTFFKGISKFSAKKLLSLFEENMIIVAGVYV